MADLLPLRGVRYNAQAVDGDIRLVAAPPYDVISPDEQNRLYATHPHNVIRLILGREPDRYESADRHFRDWLANGSLVLDHHPAFYLYRQTFADPFTGETAPERVGFVCLLKLEDYASGKVLPHENTLTSAKADRLDLLRATKAQFESIQGLYSDEDGVVRKAIDASSKNAVVVNVDDMIGSSHSIEPISDTAAILSIQRLMKDKAIFIADGHHRYETSLNYRREVRAEQGVPDDASIPEDYILITLTAFEDPGLLVLPTHRQVKNLDPSTVASLPSTLTDRFTVEPIDRNRIEAAITDAAHRGRKAIGMVLPGNQAYLATLNANVDAIPQLIPGNISDAAKRLDVTILQSLILNEKLGITPELLAAGQTVGYTRDPHDAVDSVETGAFQAAFILGRPSVDDVRLVSLARDKMPQKSTFFYPKLLSGLVMRDLAGERDYVR